jgi:hypothetical protein
MSKFFNVKYLAVMILIVAAVIGVGNAAAFTFSNTDLNVVEGYSDAFTADEGAVTYSIDTDGDVTATLVVADTYDLASGSLTGAAGSYITCTPTAAQIVCVFPNASLNAGTHLYIVATKD